MTLLYTGAGIAAFGFGLALGWEALETAGAPWTLAYLSTLGVALIAAVGVGFWWFVSGTGERRLRQVLDATFPSAAGP
jgi:hypothetical protein